MFVPNDRELGYVALEGALFGRHCFAAVGRHANRCSRKDWLLRVQPPLLQRRVCSINRVCVRILLEVDVSESMRVVGEDSSISTNLSSSPPGDFYVTLGEA